MGADDSELVVAAAAATLQEAEVLRAALSGFGISAYVQNANAAAMMPHLALAINRGGVRVLVRRGDLAAAREALVPKDGITDEDWQAPPDLANEPPAKEELPEADEYAKMAALFGVLWIFIPPLLLATPYCLLRALAAARKGEVRDRLRFQKNTGIALVLGVIVPWLLIASLIWTNS